MRELNFKYRKSFARLVPGSSGHFRDYSRKWVVLASAVGIITSALVILLDEIIRILLLGNAFNEGSPITGLITRIYYSSPIFSFLLPFAGMIIAGLLLRYFASEPLLTGTDEVLEHYHSKREGLRGGEGAVKYIASIFTIGFGGSAGLEGPSINAGGVVGSWIWRSFASKFGLTVEDLRILLLAGASAGIAAIFKAPLTGIVFALEVPYKDDIARKAFLPSIISGVVSYATFASVEGAQPLFKFAQVNAGFSLLDVAFSAFLGLLIGILTVGFSALYHAIQASYDQSKTPLIARFLIGGAAMGIIGVIVRIFYTQPLTFGAGYNLIQGSLAGSFTVQFLAVVLMLRILATAFTLGSGGVGGIFFPQVVFGSLAGSLFGLLVHGNVAVFASVGIASFMSAGYKTPLAAVTFVGDTTASVSYLIPAMVASAIAYITSGESTVSNQQKLWEEPR